MVRLHSVSSYFRIFVLCLAAWVSMSVYGQEESPEPEIDRLAPDFVRASVIVAEPYDVLYSCYGHAALRLQCPTFDLDYIFTCEGEAAQDNIQRFLLGQLQMGVYSIPTQAFLSEYADQGRGVMEYELSLPPEVKQLLWQQMDERVSQPHTPYDFVQNGCAHLILKWLDGALGSQHIVISAWPETFGHTRKVIAGAACRRFHWTHLFISTLIDGSLNNSCVRREKVILPQDLVFVMQHATLQNQPLLQADPIELLPSRQQYGGGSWFVSPLALSLVLLVITLLLLFMGRSRASVVSRLGLLWCWLMLVFQFAIGLFLCYLVFFSSLPCTEWNWLLIPFSPLPLLLWRWRRRWRWPALAIVGVWCVAVVAAPFIYHDYAYLPLALSMALLPWVHNTKPHPASPKGRGLR